MATTEDSPGGLEKTCSTHTHNHDHDKEQGGVGSQKDTKSSLTTSTTSTAGMKSFLEISPSGEEDDDDDSKCRRRSFLQRAWSTWSWCGWWRSVEFRYMAGMLLAGWAMSCLTTTFQLFHVELFLTAYALDLSAYASGNVVYAVLNTANDVAGAWIVDSMAASSSSSSRSNMVGPAGALFGLCFCTPFFRWAPRKESSSSAGWWWDATHFVVSLSLYDTLFSFVAILLGSMFTDDLGLDEAVRVQFMAVFRFTGIVLSLVIPKIGLSFFQVQNLFPFRVYVVTLAVVCTGAFAVAQAWMQPRQAARQQQQQQSSEPKEQEEKKTTLKLRPWTVLCDFAQHRNFRFWIVSEMLLEGQMTFTRSFQKTFVEHLLVNSGNGWFTRDNCHWLLSCIGPLCQVASLLIYAPIRQWGYHAMYMWLFGFKIVLGGVMLLWVSSANATAIAAFLVVEAMATGAVQGGGFHLAMSDMVTEMKYNQRLIQGRHDEPSLAGLFMGANALFCKPMESLLPIVAAGTLQAVGFGNTSNDNDQKETTDAIAHRLYLLLVVPPFCFSIVSALFFYHYDLVRNGKAEKMRRQLQSVLRKGEEEEEERLLEQGDF